MRNEFQEICIELAFPYGKPDANGVIYTKESIEKALRKGVSNLPITYLGNNLCAEEDIIGHVKEEPVIVEWDDLNGVCNIKVKGTLFAAGTSCVVDKMKDGIVESFEIKSFGVSNL